ncbi:ferrochelatase [Fulvivirga sp. 29W222]|uniref:Ferrochelatase n=1 Tax=Fulvivirga marina TaxID=2494733 RepID=A0A937G0I9_9BACT|nr:ferrochelatase [Fulvivirga marina]MBL6448402.1 ferrochelatase [Fulvivirga marina]
MSRTGVLVVNLGTPDEPEYKAVKRYLTEFLMDGRVIDIPFWKRFLLVNGIIAPFRSRKVAKEYKKLWTRKGSPLLTHGLVLVHKLLQKFDSSPWNVEVELAMRYQNPSIEMALKRLRIKGVDELIVFPLFPQYASATTGSVNQKVMEIISQWQVIPSIQFLNSYHSHPEFINAFAAKVLGDISQHQPDHVLFSYHGIPERHLDRIRNESDYCNSACNCSDGEHQQYCYRSACFHTSKLIAESIGLETSSYSTSFQSRLGKDPWIQPYTDATIEELARNGVKNLLVVSPSFVADCLETTLEIGEEYRDLFLEHGGEKFNFTESLNTDNHWVEAVFNIISTKYFNTEENRSGRIFNLADAGNNVLSSTGSV